MALSDQISAAIRGGRPRAFLGDGNAQNDVLFDVISNYSYDQSARVTAYAIEKGAAVTDHVIQSPNAWSISALLTNEDIDALDPSSWTAKNIVKRRDQLTKWKQEGTLLTYYNQDGNDIKSVVLESVKEEKTMDTGSGIALSLNLKEVTLATSETATVQIAGSPTNAGPTPQNSSKTPVTNVRKSDLLRLGGG